MDDVVRVKVMVVEEDPETSRAIARKLGPTASTSS